MIKINLLPEELKKTPKPSKAFKFDINALGPKAFKALIIFLSALVALHIILVVSIFLKDSSLKRADLKWQKLQPVKIEIERISDESRGIEKRILPIRQLIEGRAMWARRLNQISDLLTPGIWLTRIYQETHLVDTQKGVSTRALNLEGCASSVYGDETALVAKFIKSLQEDKDFSGQFSEIKPGPMEKAMLENNPVMNFKITCFYRGDKSR